MCDKKRGHFLAFLRQRRIRPWAEKCPRFYFIVISIFLSSILTGCGLNAESYPSAHLRESLLKICREEYGIQDLEVKVTGDTVGVYLPLTQLFAHDLKEKALQSNLRNLDSMFEPSAEAMNKVEDVLFTISRVLLSTDKNFNFYVLQATDIQKTGLQLVLVGAVGDIRRVRIWDISRDEYRRRIIHELRLNRAVVWHRPVKKFFEDLSRLPLEEIRQNYFSADVPLEAIEKLFYDPVQIASPDFMGSRWEILDARSAMMQKNEIAVYVKVRPYEKNSAAQLPPDTEPARAMEFLFMLKFRKEEAKLVRIVPFQYYNEAGIFEKIPFPDELALSKDLDKWEQEFPVPDIQWGDFLADQAGRRVQGIFSTDERIHMTFRDLAVQFRYENNNEAPLFEVDIEALVKEDGRKKLKKPFDHEYLRYMLNLTLKEFAYILRTYQFSNFDEIQINFEGQNAVQYITSDQLELFRKGKLLLEQILT